MYYAVHTCIRIFVPIPYMYKYIRAVATTQKAGSITFAHQLHTCILNA